MILSNLLLVFDKTWGGRKYFLEYYNELLQKNLSTTFIRIMKEFLVSIVSNNTRLYEFSFYFNFHSFYGIIFKTHNRLEIIYLNICIILFQGHFNYLTFQIFKFCPIFNL